MGYKGSCIICLSPYEKEVVSMREQKIPWKVIYEKYKKPMGYKAKQVAFTQIISIHIRENHKAKVSVIPSNLAQSAVTLDAFAQRMLELGVEKLNGMEAKDIQFNDVLNAQKVMQESKKLKLTEDAMLIMMRKMFAPPETNTIEGELA